jgi:CBS domain-containing protein
MICPNCGHDNLPGAEECSGCLQDLTQLDRPVATNKVERSLMEDPVRIFCKKKPVVIKQQDSLAKAVQIMLDESIGAVLVVSDKGELVGILSERDLLTKAAGHHSDFSKLSVEPFMTPNPETVKTSDTIAFALHKMDVGGYRHLPVLKDGRPYGVISVRDMLRHIVHLCKDN